MAAPSGNGQHVDISEDALICRKRRTLTYDPQHGQRMFNSHSVTRWIEQLRQGNEDAAKRLWYRYFQRLVELARDRMGPVTRRIADEEDTALSVMDGLCQGAEQGRFDQMADRDKRWRLMFTITAHKVIESARFASRQKRGDGQVRDAAWLRRDRDAKVAED